MDLHEYIDWLFFLDEQNQQTVDPDAMVQKLVTVGADEADARNYIMQKLKTESGVS